MLSPGELAPVSSDGPKCYSGQPTSSASASQNSPSIPAEGDWLEASDLDGDRWVKPEDIDSLWGQPPAAAMLNTHSHTLPVPAVGSVSFVAAAGDEPSPKRLRLSASPSPIRLKASGHHPSAAAHHTMVDANLPADHAADTTATSQLPSKEDTLFTDPNADAESEDDTGSSGDASASLRPLQAGRQQPASSQHSAGSVSEVDEADDPDFRDLATQASSQSFSSDDDSESSDGFEGAPSRYCINCMSRMYLGEMMCLDCGHAPSEDLSLFDHRQSSKHQLPTADRVLLAYDERMTLHSEGPSSSHPERPDRIRAVMARLHACGLTDRCQPLPVREATVEEVTACHGPDHMARVAKKSAIAAADVQAGGTGQIHFSPDTYVNQHTLLCARLSAGACADVATAVVRQEATTGIAVVRPPGHHAESNTVMGFCFFNNAAIAARAAQAAGAERVLILDWDVHHGNGTQEIFEEDPTVMYMSIHRHDRGMFYPGTGAHHATGTGPGEGYSVNVPWLTGGMGNGDYMAAFYHVLLPIAYEFNPSLIIVSAGFDAAVGDPIGGCKVTEECFGQMTAMLQPVAPLAVLLEGGYNLSATAAATEACLRVLLGEKAPALPLGDRAPSPYGLATIQQVIRTQGQYWSCLRGLVPAAQPSPQVAAAPRLYPQVNPVPVASQQNGHAALPAAGTAQVQQASAEAHLHRDIVTHDDAHDPFGAEDTEAVAAPAVSVQRAAVPPKAVVHVQPTTGPLHNRAAAQKDRPHTAGSVLQNTAVADSAHDAHPRVTMSQSPGHQNVTDNKQSGHRLLADSQEPRKSLDRSLHSPRIWAQACQGKSQQRLMLMTALHRTAHKQLQRQHKHVGLQRTRSSEAP